MGFWKNAQLEINGAVQHLWSAMRQVQYLKDTPKWARSRPGYDFDFANAKQDAAEARAEITALKRRYGIKKRGYSIDASDIPIR